MSDRELLELAAKAIGRCLHKNTRDSHGNWGTDTYCTDCGKSTYGDMWNPLTDDGDALRLAVKLGIYVKHFPALEDDAMEYPGFVEAWRLDEIDPIVTEYLNQREPNERLEATRHVIVRAAAEIGKAMK